MTTTATTPPTGEIPPVAQPEMSNKLPLDLPEGWDAGLTAEQRQECLDSALQTALTEIARRRAAGACPSWCQYRDDASHVKGGTDHHGPVRHVEATGSEPWIELDQGAIYSGASASAYQERLDNAPPSITLDFVHVQPPYENFEGRREPCGSTSGRKRPSASRRTCSPRRPRPSRDRPADLHPTRLHRVRSPALAHPPELPVVRRNARASDERHRFRGRHGAGTGVGQRDRRSVVSGLVFVSGDVEVTPAPRPVRATARRRCRLPTREPHLAVGHRRRTTGRQGTQCDCRHRWYAHTTRHRLRQPLDRA